MKVYVVMDYGVFESEIKGVFKNKEDAEAFDKGLEEEEHGVEEYEVIE